MVTMLQNYGSVGVRTFKALVLKLAKLPQDSVAISFSRKVKEVWPVTIWNGLIYDWLKCI